MINRSPTLSPVCRVNEDSEKKPCPTHLSPFHPSHTHTHLPSESPPLSFGWSRITERGREEEPVVFSPLDSEEGQVSFLVRWFLTMQKEEGGLAYSAERNICPISPRPLYVLVFLCFGKKMEKCCTFRQILPGEFDLNVIFNQ